MDALRGFKHGRTLEDLATKLGVSERTIRRDLQELADADVRVELSRVDGRAAACLKEVSYREVPVTRREQYTLRAARRVFDVLRGTSFHEDAESVLAKFEQEGYASVDLHDWRRGFGVFAVERFVEADHVRKSAFEIPADFQIEEVLHGAFGVHVGDPANARRVVVEFSAEKTELVIGRVWHPTQELKRVAGGRMRLDFTCTNLKPVVSWILQWGPHAKVIEPTELAAMIIDELDRACAQYAAP